VGIQIEHEYGIVLLQLVIFSAMAYGKCCIAKKGKTFTVICKGVVVTTPKVHSDR
jgi:hypothetical protein